MKLISCHIILLRLSLKNKSCLKAEWHLPDTDASSWVIFCVVVSKGILAEPETIITTSITPMHEPKSHLESVQLLAHSARHLQARDTPLHQVLLLFLMPSWTVLHLETKWIRKTECNFFSFFFCVCSRLQKNLGIFLVKSTHLIRI